MSDPIATIRQLGSFDHAACDAKLRAAHVDVPGILLNRSSADNMIYGENYAICGWFLTCALLAVAAWCVPGRVWAPRWSSASRSLVRALLIISAVGLGLVVPERLFIVERYVSACRTILHVP